MPRIIQQGASARRPASANVADTAPLHNKLMLFSTILSVLNYRDEMAVVRLRCDTKGYFNWRDQYIGAMNIRVRRRDLNVADRYLWFQSNVDRLKEQVRARSASIKQYARTKLAGMPIKLSQIGAQLPVADRRYPWAARARAHHIDRRGDEIVVIWL